MKPRVLVIDDGLDYARVVEEQMPEFDLIRPKHGEPARLPDGPTALAYLSKHAAEVDVVLLDMRFDVPEERLLPVAEGFSTRRTKRFQGVAILRELRRRFVSLPVVLLTAVEDLSLVDVDGELAAQSLTYFLGSDDLDTLRIRINAALQESAQDLEEEGILWGRDRRMQALRRRLGVLARGAIAVILEGETGTGKSFLAERFIHENSGRQGPFVVLDLASIPRDLIPAHLFGALRGAFTGSVVDRKGVFEMAHHGTLFIDEIQNAPLEVQKQLLLVLQDKRLRPLGASKQIDVDVKVIAGSNTPLDRAVAEGRFRQDLYMRLGPATRARLPPIRELRGDFAFYARRLAERAAHDPDNEGLCHQVASAAGLPADTALSLRIGRDARHGPGVELVMPGPAWKMLSDHPWPGNLRELSMVMHNLVTFTLVAAVDAIRQGLPVTSTSLQIDTGLVGELLAAAAPLDANTGPTAASGHLFHVRLQAGRTLNAVANDVERQCYRALFERTRGDFAQMAAVLLGDPAKGRAVRLRFNQLGLKVRELR